MKKLFALVSLVLLLSVRAFAQEGYMVEITNDVKTVHPAQLGLPESATLTEVLSLLPELLCRSKMDIMTNYDIQVGGFSLGADKEAAMTMLHVSDIESIDISESSVNSYTNKGSGGSINISLKKMEKGLSGNIDVMAYSVPEVSPTVQLGFRKDKLYVRGLFGFNWLRKAGSIIDREYIYPSFTSSDALGLNSYAGADTTTRRSTFEMAHIYAQYTPGDADLFSLQVSQSYRKLAQDIRGLLIQFESPFHVEKQTAENSLNLSVEAMYRHTFANKSVLRIQGNYSGLPKYSSTDDSFARNMSTNNKSGTVSGKVDYTCHFRNAGAEDVSSLNVGINANRTNSDSQHEEILNIFGLTRFSHNSNTSGVTTYFSPYASFETLLGKVRLKAMADYQYFHYNLKAVDEQDFNTHRNDFTCKFMAGWQMGDHNHLQLRVDRSITRPSNILLYPVVLYDASMSEFYKGNPNLAPEQIHEVALDYITDVKTKSGGYFMANVNIAYIHVADRIRPMQGDNASEKKYPYAFMSYTNSGFNNIANANVMLYFRKGVFNLSLTGNVYANYDVNDSVTDHYNYYSLSLYPSFHFKNDWRTSLQVIYHSPVSTNDVSYGNSAFASLYVGKSWNNFYVGLAGRLQLIKRTTDIIHGANDLVTTETYVPGYNYVALNLNYRF